MIAPLIAAAFALLAFITIMWVLAYRDKRLDLVDVAWGGGFCVVAAAVFVGAIRKNMLTETLVVVCVLMAVWAARLTTHLYKRVASRKDEDARYAELRKQWKGSEAFNSYIRIFLLQGILIFAIAFPPLIVMRESQIAAGPWIIIGSFVWLVGFICESVSDRQLVAFMANPKNKGKLITSGLWKYSRHPNYFGEVTLWWGIFLCTVPAWFVNSSYFWIAIISPVIITILILFVSGIPILEKLMSKRKGWDDYEVRTSIFLPLPPKKR